MLIGSFEVVGQLETKQRINAVGDPPKDNSWIRAGSTKLLTSVGDTAYAFLLLETAMNINDENLNKEELQYLIERLGGPEDKLADEPDTLLGISTADRAALQTDLKMRLQRGIEEMRARKEEVPERLLELIERL